MIYDGLMLHYNILCVKWHYGLYVNYTTDSIYGIVHCCYAVIVTYMRQQMCRTAQNLSNASQCFVYRGLSKP